MNEMNIEYIPLGEIKPYENNPRVNDDAVKYVVNSIKEFGFKVPIVIDKKNVIIAGHTRFKAAKDLGLEKVPCIRANDLSEDQVKAFRIADNKVSEFSRWDLEKLNVELDSIDLNMNEFGFSEFNIEVPRFDELERKSDNEENNKKNFTIKIVFETYEEWLKNENEIKNLVENSNAVLSIC